ncbi:MAG: hypothetical protein ACK559_22820, partial [bacterium]
LHRGPLQVGGRGHEQYGHPRAPGLEADLAEVLLKVARGGPQPIEGPRQRGGPAQRLRGGGRQQPAQLHEELQPLEAGQGAGAQPPRHVAEAALEPGVAEVVVTRVHDQQVDLGLFEQPGRQRGEVVAVEARGAEVEHRQAQPLAEQGGELAVDLQRAVAAAHAAAADHRRAGALDLPRERPDGETPLVQRVHALVVGEEPARGVLQGVVDPHGRRRGPEPDAQAQLDPAQGQGGDEQPHPGAQG